MKIEAFTVCVQYADLLRKSIETWKRTLDSLCVITTPTDIETLQLCVAWDVPTYQTNAFYADGAVFNKGRAIAEAYAANKPTDWCLFFDADIIPPPDWREVAEELIRPGALFGAQRQHEDGSVIQDGELAGYFHLFHTADPAVQGDDEPIVDTCWCHAGAYDSYFAMRWHPRDRIVLPINVTHQGETGQNWFGRGNHELMRQMREERIRRGGHQHERIDCADL